MNESPLSLELPLASPVLHRQYGYIKSDRPLVDPVKFIAKSDIDHRIEFLLSLFAVLLPSSLLETIKVDFIKCRLLILFTHTRKTHHII